MLPPDGLHLTGKSTVVTGAARGIGRAIAHRLASLGARVDLWDLDGEEAERCATELQIALTNGGLRPEITWRQVDITDLGVIEEALRPFAPEGLDILVNNAGVTSVQSADNMPLDVWDSTLRVNLTGTYLCCRASIPYLKRKVGSTIVNISSSAALVGGGGGAHYAASKAGVEGLI